MANVTRITAALAFLLLAGCAEENSDKLPDLCQPQSLECVGKDVWICNGTGTGYDLLQTCVGGTVCIGGACQVVADAMDAAAETDGGPDAVDVSPRECDPDQCGAVHGSPPMCYLWACVEDECRLQPVQNGKACDDDNACTEGDVCQEGKCLGNQDSCDDGIACTVDGCSLVHGCIHETQAAACDDSDPCTADICSPEKGCKNIFAGGPECKE